MWMRFALPMPSSRYDTVPVVRSNRLDRIYTSSAQIKTDSTTPQSRMSATREWRLCSVRIERVTTAEIGTHSNLHSIVTRPLCYAYAYYMATMTVYFTAGDNLRRQHTVATWPSGSQYLSSLQSRYRQFNGVCKVQIRRSKRQVES